jgi:hypothetical protein
MSDTESNLDINSLRTMDAYTLTKESILKKRDAMMKKNTEFCQHLKVVGDAAKDEMGVEFDIIEIYSIMNLLETRLIDSEPKNASTLMYMIHDCAVAAGTGDSHEIEVIVKYYQDYFEEKVKVC